MDSYEFKIFSCGCLTVLPYAFSLSGHFIVDILTL